MKKFIASVAVLGLTAISSNLLAHGIHDHAAVFADGGLHPASGMEHAVLLAVITGLVYLSLKLLRK
jgi:hydrogenase/urease accessory protein HupE